MSKENTEPTEKEFDDVLKGLLTKKPEQTLKSCSKYPTAKELNQKFKFIKKPK